MTEFDCPRCRAVLTMTERHGIEIDYCPQCRGIWLDRGELDKIIERIGALPPAAERPASGWTQPAAAAWAPPPGQQPIPHRHDDDWDNRRKGQYGKPRKHWLSELFD